MGGSGPDTVLPWDCLEVQGLGALDLTQGHSPRTIWQVQGVGVWT